MTTFMSDAEETAWEAERDERARVRAERWAELMDVAALVAARVNPITVHARQYTGDTPSLSVQVSRPRLAANQLFGPENIPEPRFWRKQVSFEGVFEDVLVSVFGTPSREEQIANVKATLVQLESEGVAS